MLRLMHLRGLCAGISALFFALAPLICLQFCTLRHQAHDRTASAHVASAQHSHSMHVAHGREALQDSPIDTASDSGPDEAQRAPLDEYQRMLISVLELLPSVATAVLPHLVWSATAIGMLLLSARALRPPNPPPRPGFRLL
jgi:hypothetical protein